MITNSSIKLPRFLGWLWIVLALWAGVDRVVAAPAISAIADQAIEEDSSTSTLSFLISGFESRNPTVTGSSGNSQLVADSGIAITGSGRSWSVTVTPLPNQFGTATITIKVDDPAGTDTEDFVVTVRAVNDRPTITDITDQSTNEDQPAGPITFTINDVDTPVASLEITTSTSNGNVVPASGISVGGSGNTRTLTITPAANQSGSSTIGVFVSDGSLNATTRFTLTVNPVNDPPTISDVPDQTINENGQAGPVSFSVNDPDNSPGGLTVTGTSSNPTLVPNGNIVIGTAATTGTGRSVTVTPARTQFGTAVITLTVSDGTSTATDTFTLTVNPLNRPPTISDVADQSISEDTSLAPVSFNVGDNETGPDNLTVTRSSSNQTLVPDANISLGGSGANRTVSITPTANAFGSAVITLTVSDGTLTATDQFTINVTSVNDLPTISNVADVSISENGQVGPLPFTVADLETGLADLIVTGSSSNPNLIPNGNVVIGSTPGAGRTVTVTPVANSSGSAVITLTVNDGSATASDTFTVTVTAVNRAPTISNIADQTTPEDSTLGPVAFTIGDVETIPDNLTITRSSGNQTLIPDGNIVLGGSGVNRTLTISPVANGFGSALITVTVSDGVLSATDQFTVNVTSVNDLPTISNVADVTVSENSQAGPLPFTVSDLETGLADLIVTGSSSNPNLIPNANIVIGSTPGAGRTVTVTPAANSSGSAVITLTVNDGSATASDTFTVTVTAVNRAPTISNIADQSTPEDSTLGPVAFTIGDVETNPDNLTITRSSGNQTLIPDGNIVLGGSGANRTLTITPVANGFGSALITVTVSDGSLSATDQFTVNVTSVNDPPAISDVPDQAINENSQLGPVALVVGDLETAPANLVITGSSSNPNLVPNGNIVILTTAGAGPTLTITPLQNQSGTALITLTVSDGQAIASDTFNLTVSAVNRVPTISNVPDQTTPEDTTLGPISFTINDTETSSDNLTITRSSSNQSLVPDASIVLGGSGGSRTLTITPITNASGSALITLTVSDGSLSASDQFTLTVTSVNDLPTITDVPDQSINENGQAGPLSFVVNDLETGPANLVVTASSSNPTLIPNGNIVIGTGTAAGGARTVTVTPVRSQSGIAQITLTVSDGTGTASDSFTVSVNAVNRPPTISDIGDTNVPSGSSTPAIAFQIGDPDTGPANLTLSALSSNPGLIPISGIVFGGSGANRTVTITPTGTQQGSVTITVTVSDGSLSASDVFTVRVTEGQQFDFGDAPESSLAVLYRTRITSGGPRHRIIPNFFLGQRVDAEPDGQPSVDALGDDQNPSTSDDEDGVQFASALSAGKTATLIVTSSSQGVLDGWFDFNRAGGFEAAEHAINKVGLVPGPNTVTVNVPATAAAGETFARFRLSRGGLDTPDHPSSTTPIPEGEVEDYRVTIIQETVQLDFGDAPETVGAILNVPGYPTLLASNGARHVVNPDFFLGKLIDPEADGQPNVDATGDDINPVRLDDEDGVVLPSALVPGQTAQIVVTASQSGRLDAWVDFNRNRSWADQGEQVFFSVALAGGANTLTFSVPSTAQGGRTFARFRYSREGKLGFAGQAPDGEVEDYAVTIDAGGPCDLDAKGTDFWLTFPGNHPQSETAPLAITLCIVGTAGTTGLVEIAGSRYTNDFIIPAAMSTMITLPDSASLGEVVDVVQNKGVHVVANAPVAVYGLHRIPYSSDGFLGLPTATLGQQYIVMGYPNVFADVSALNGTQFGLVATQDDTLVTIIPSRTVLGHPAGEPFILELKKGRTYQLRDPEDATADLSGTEIISNKPIAVFGSHQCANINSPSRLFCDYLVEQLPPVNAFGKVFYSVPLLTRIGGDTFRAAAAYNNTKLFVNGVENATLDRGEVRTLTLSAAARITSDKPVYLAQFANSSDFDNVENADPFMVMVPPTKFYSRNHMICTGPNAFPNHYVNIVAPGSVVGALTLDGAAIPAASFTPIGASGFSFARITVAQGTHTLAAAQPFGTIVYGFAQYESYGWPGGLTFGDVTPPVMTCPADFTVPIGGVIPTTGATSCLAVVPDLRGQVQVSDNCLLPSERVVTQTPPPGTLLGVGVHEITLTARDAADNETSCTVLMTVIDPGIPVITCPRDILAPCTKGTGANVVFSAFAQTPCGTPAEVECSPESGSFFPAGTTTVTCRVKGFPNQTCTFKVTVQCTLIGNGNLPVPRSVTLTWPEGSILETADQIGGPWVPVPGATSPFDPAPVGGQQYFRLRAANSATAARTSLKRPALSIQRQ